MNGWPKQDGNLILYFEIVLMALFIIMNATDVQFQSMNSGNVISQFVRHGLKDYHFMLLKESWWLHIAILIFLNYLYYSKHLTSC